MARMDSTGTSERTADDVVVRDLTWTYYGPPEGPYSRGEDVTVTWEQLRADPSSALEALAWYDWGASPEQDSLCAFYQGAAAALASM